jgi:CRISPR-associated protein Cmr5
MQTRDQQYSTIILKQVTKIKNDYAKNEEFKKYGSMCFRLPILIRTAGLAQALAFVEARASSPGSKILKKIPEHIQATIDPENPEESLLRRAQEAELPMYMRLTQEVLAALLWYTRFTQSVLNMEGPEEAERIEE